MKSEVTPGQAKKIYLADYRAPDFEILKTELWFHLDEKRTRVRSELAMRRTTEGNFDLVLDGEDLTLETVSVDGVLLNATEYTRGEKNLSLRNLPNAFTLAIEVTINPSANTQLSGLYSSRGMLTTQCEAEGFRRITYYLDRPDIMSTFRVHVLGDKKKFPVMLSNGDIVPSSQKGEIIYDDPFKKASYLFALVAGDFGVLKDHFVTMSGKNVALEIYADHSVIHRCGHAMESLKRSLKWDEVRFGREYDLATFRIAAISDFNSGAMENKGLNIFNARLILADSETATDLDYYLIESVIAHEYFHNWTGNRVTLRDWFHLSLKEGLTVFRDQEFSMDLHSASGVRIDSVAELRDRQFAEDAGPNSHPIRPESCYAVDNFYTSTIYEKGAEVIRMLQTLVGRPGFRSGMDLYFERHDGQAVIIEDFAKAIADANKIDLGQFQLWYSQAGTPTVSVHEVFDLAKGELKIQLAQTCPKTFRESEDSAFAKKPFHIPLELALFDSTSGSEVSLSHPRVRKNSEGKFLFELKGATDEMTISGLTSRPTLSINRNFSAPVRINHPVPAEDNFVLLENETDAFSKWEASQRIYERLLLARAMSTEEELYTIDRLGKILSRLLETNSADLSVLVKLLSMPSDSWLAQNDDEFDAHFYASSRKKIKTSLAQVLEKALLTTVEKYAKTDTAWNHRTMAERHLKNTSLDYLATLDTHQKKSWAQFETSKLMTDVQASFETLVETDRYRTQAIEKFYDRWRHENLVLNKWFSVQSLAHHPQTFTTVQALWNHPDFDKKNPNRVYSVLLRFGLNLALFHQDQTVQPTYAWAADKIREIDAINPQVAARVASIFNFCQRTKPALKEEALRVLENLLAEKISPNTFEILNNAVQELRRE